MYKIECIWRVKLTCRTCNFRACRVAGRLAIGETKCWRCADTSRSRSRTACRCCTIVRRLILPTWDLMIMRRCTRRIVTIVLVTTRHIVITAVTQTCKDKKHTCLLLVQSVYIPYKVLYWSYFILFVFYMYKSNYLTCATDDLSGIKPRY